MTSATVEASEFKLHAPDGTDIFVRAWRPELDRQSEGQLRGVVQIAHGLMEHAGRYSRFARFLNEAGYVVYANDHRGHGHTAKTIADIGSVGKDALNWMVKDMHQLTRFIKDQHESLPVFLFGHSMGSFLAQRYISLYGNDIDGVILSGSSGKFGPIVQVGLWLARREMRSRGPDWRSQRLSQLTFGPYNRQFKPPKTSYDWHSRDEVEVKAFMDDPLCGVTFSTEFFYEFGLFLRDLHKKSLMSGLPRNLPIYIFSGDKDPVSKNGRGVLRLVSWYKSLGQTNVSYKLYKGGRHEMLNEVNRDEVMADVVSWLSDRTP